MFSKKFCKRLASLTRLPRVQQLHHAREGDAGRRRGGGHAGKHQPRAPRSHAQTARRTRANASLRQCARPKVGFDIKNVVLSARIS